MAKAVKTNVHALRIDGNGTGVMSWCTLASDQKLRIPDGLVKKSGNYKIKPCPKRSLIFCFNLS